MLLWSNAPNQQRDPLDAHESLLPGTMPVAPWMSGAGEIGMLRCACDRCIRWLTLDARCSSGPFMSNTGIEMLAKATRFTDLALVNIAITPLP